MTDQLKKKIRHVPDFPKAGILFYDITTLLQDAEGFGAAVDCLAGPFRGKSIDLVVGIESRGFIFGAAVADRLGTGFTPVRKPGKLPSSTIKASYSLEYGHRLARDACRCGEEGPARAPSWTPTCWRQAARRGRLWTSSPSWAVTVYALAFLIELVALNGREAPDRREPAPS
jgi:hypothetical protein